MSARCGLGWALLYERLITAFYLGFAQGVPHSLVAWYSLAWYWRVQWVYGGSLFGELALLVLGRGPALPH